MRSVTLRARARAHTHTHTHAIVTELQKAKGKTGLTRILYIFEIEVGLTNVTYF
jgi:hypothetical protein